MVMGGGFIGVGTSGGGSPAVTGAGKIITWIPGVVSDPARMVFGTFAEVNAAVQAAKPAMVMVVLESQGALGPFVADVPGVHDWSNVMTMEGQPHINISTVLTIIDGVVFQDLQRIGAYIEILTLTTAANEPTFRLTTGGAIFSIGRFVSIRTLSSGNALRTTAGQLIVIEMERCELLAGAAPIVSCELAGDQVVIIARDSSFIEPNTLSGAGTIEMDFDGESEPHCSFVHAALSGGLTTNNASQLVSAQQQGRLSVTTDPVGDGTATILNYLTYTGPNVAIPDGLGALRSQVINGQMLAAVGLTIGEVYDVFARIDDARDFGGLTLVTRAWVSTAARGYTLATTNGVLTNPDALNELYLGTVQVVDSGGAVPGFRDVADERKVWNANNRVRRSSVISPTAATTTVPASAPAWVTGFSPELTVAFVTGQERETVRARANLYNEGAASPGEYRVAVDIDLASVPAADCVTGATTNMAGIGGKASQAIAEYEAVPAIGARTATLIMSTDVDMNFLGDSGGVRHSGLIVDIYA